MNETMQEKIKSMIASELGAAAASKEMTDEQNKKPEAPRLPALSKLDEFESLLIDAIRWRTESLEKTLAKAKEEEVSIKKMKEQLLGRACTRLGVSTRDYNVQINSTTKEIQIEKRG